MTDLLNKVEKQTKEKTPDGQKSNQTEENDERRPEPEHEKLEHELTDGKQISKSTKSPKTKSADLPDESNCQQGYGRASANQPTGGPLSNNPNNNSPAIEMNPSNDPKSLSGYHRRLPLDLAES